MTTDAPEEIRLDSSLPSPDRFRWRALVVIALAQLMVVLDGSIVNIALPSIQNELGISDTDRQWIVTAYTLAFGSLLLLGGRVADYSGRKRMFVIGLIGFALASALGGLAPNAATLFASRGLQGLFAALLAPAALSLISVTFTNPHERARAFGVYGAIAGGGAAIGLIMGGLLTEYADWRWCLLVNVPIALVAVILAVLFVTESRNEGRARYDIPGAITATVGLFSLVFGITQAENSGWGSATTIGFLALAAGLLVAFVLIQARSASPMLPLRLVKNRVRGAAYLAAFFVGIAGLSFFLFISYFLQLVLAFTPLQTGLGFLPFSGGVIVSATVASRLLPRIGPRFITFTGFILMAVAMFAFSQLTVTSQYASAVLPFIIIASLGFGLIFVPLSSSALHGVDNNDSGIAAATLNTSQQIGGTIGIAALNTLAASITMDYIAHNGLQSPNAEALIAGLTPAFTVSSAVLLLMGIAWVLIIGKQDIPTKEKK
ncbi:MFS transporter [Cryobacterium sp. SO1]|uniref:MFS transporter n=1 Tax=Cryobacterium sp. SO1 TaxID=1897061 RepID=UPI00102306CC|nr:MFS transporter [Cryobacterium sp. SO1]RZI37574.1 putative MFS-type transporter EfpA [Cryobacterium sp. SO1]